MNNILSTKKRLVCIDSEDSNFKGKPKVELVRIRKGEEFRLFLRKNKIIFPAKGRSVCIVNNNMIRQADTGYMLFVPSGHHLTIFTDDSEALLVIFRIDVPVNICGKYSLGGFYGNRKKRDVRSKNESDAGILKLRGHLSRGYIDNIVDYLNTATVDDHYYNNIKMRELLLLLGHHYTKEELSQFFDHIGMNPDINFSKYVEANRTNYPTVIALAASMHMTQKQFAKRFKAIFHRTPYGWMKEGKISNIHSALTTTDKVIAQIASDNGYSASQFTKFCKKEIGKTPTELRNLAGTVPSTNHIKDITYKNWL